MDRLDPESLVDGVHVWYCNPDAIDDAQLLGEYATLLSDEEQERWQRFRSDRDRHRYLVSRALIRDIISRYGELPPDEWRFTRNRWGKPEIEAAQNALELRPNWAHTSGLACVAITRVFDLGLDVEYLGRKSPLMRIAKRYFADGEVQELSQLADSEREMRFFQLWTLKEAYIKARGIGVASGLRNFAFGINDDGVIGVRFAPEFDDSDEGWCFSLLTPTNNHLAALALHGREGNVIPTILLRETIPLH